MLTDAKIRKTKPADKPFKLTDSNGLHLMVRPNGSRVWRYKYRIKGSEKLLTIGPYPEIGLAKARTLRDEARQAVRDGRDPSREKKLGRNATLNPSLTFEAQANDWFKVNKGQWTEKHSKDVWGSLEKEVLPHIGQENVNDVTALMVLDVLRKIENRGAVETAHRIRQRMSAVFQFCIAKAICESDPAAQIQKAMAPVIKKRQPAITDLAGVRELIRQADQTPGHPVTKLANRLLALTVVRPGALIATPWTEFQEIAERDPVWIVPAARMKLRQHYKDDERRDHLVPLSNQAVDTIRALFKLTGSGPYALPNARHAHKPMSENAIGYLLNRAGYHHKHVPHGWRAAFSTILNERRPEERHIIDFTLAHVPKDKVEAAYNRALYLKQRRDILQYWADLIMSDQMEIEDVIKTPRRVNKKTILD